MNTFEIAALLRHLQDGHSIKMVDVEADEIPTEGFTAFGVRGAFNEEQALYVSLHCTKVHCRLSQGRDFGGRNVSTCRIAKRLAFRDYIAFWGGHIKVVRFSGADRNGDLQVKVTIYGSTKSFCAEELKSLSALRV